MEVQVYLQIHTHDLSYKHYIKVYDIWIIYSMYYSISV